MFPLIGQIIPPITRVFAMVSTAVQEGALVYPSYYDKDYYFLTVKTATLIIFKLYERS